MKSHFQFTRGQRNGIFLLLTLIIAAQSAYYFLDFNKPIVKIDVKALARFNEEVDSLRLVALKNSEPKIFPFNPNYITDYKGYTLGMTTPEIDRLLAYRKAGKWVNSAKQFQDVTQISDSLLAKIAPYFKFPEWVTNSTQNLHTNIAYNKELTFDQKQDLNTATAVQLQSVNGIGKVLSQRIVKFRNSFQGGFIANVQLEDVYGLSPEVIERLTNQFTVKTPRHIVKLNLNEATIEQLVTIQHIDYELADEIVNQRTLREGFTTIDDLLKVKDFPINKIEIIKLYLRLE